MRFILVLAACVALAFAGAVPARADDMKQDMDNLSDAQVDEVVEFTFDNALFFLFHEMGHMLISEFDLPVLGREEDAADMLSTLILLEMDDPMFDKALVDSVEGWQLSSAAGGDPDLWDTHSLDRQRAYNMVCMMVGKDATRFREAAQNVGMPEDRREECADEYSKAHDSWFKLLDSHVRRDGKESSIKVSYLNPKSHDLADYAEMVKLSGLLDIVQKVVAIYRLDDGIKLTADECGEANSYWSPADRELTFCYELSRWYVQAKVEALSGNGGQHSATADDGGGDTGGDTGEDTGGDTGGSE